MFKSSGFIVNTKGYFTAFAITLFSLGLRKTNVSNYELTGRYIVRITLSCTALVKFIIQHNFSFCRLISVTAACFCNGAPQPSHLSCNYAHGWPQWSIAVLKFIDNINAPDYAFGSILVWAKGISVVEYLFYPQDGQINLKHGGVLTQTNFICSTTPTQHCFRSYSHVLPSQMVVFDLVPQIEFASR